MLTFILFWVSLLAMLKFGWELFGPAKSMKQAVAIAGREKKLFTYFMISVACTLLFL